MTSVASVSATAECAACHESVTPEIVDQWEQSKHSTEDVGCLDCHEASIDDPSWFTHARALSNLIRG